MKKRVVLSMALLTAVSAVSVPLTSKAACRVPVAVQGGGIYKIYSGQDMENLRKTLDGLGITVGGGGCPVINMPGTPSVPRPELPDTELPGTKPPEAQEPGTEAPDDAAVSYVRQVVSLVNEERAKAGLSPLALQTDVTAAADVRAREIRQQFSHTRPDGSSFSSALRQQGVSFSGSGENIAYGQRTPQQVMEGWMNSSGHRANILNANYKNIGVGYYQDEQGVTYWVQLFTD